MLLTNLAEDAFDARFQSAAPVQERRQAFGIGCGLSRGGVTAAVAAGEPRLLLAQSGEPSLRLRSLAFDVSFGCIEGPSKFCMIRVELLDRRGEDLRVRNTRN